MTIATGDPIPDVKVWTFGESGPQATTSGELMGKGKVALFAVPGAFTPTCSMKHLPGFLEKAGELKAKGIDRIICLAVNDAFVMKAWAEHNKVDGKVEMLPDGSS